MDGEQKVLHLVPSGILHPSVHCVLGNGLVLSLPALAKEIEELQESNINFKDRFYVSEDCSLILPTHIAIDQVRDKEEALEQLVGVLVQLMKTRLLDVQCGLEI